MKIKFHLNKICKIDNIEYYTLPTILQLRNIYDEFLEDTGGIDPDFPNMSFGDGKSTINISSKEINKDGITPDKNDIMNL